jgi:hypothetical protein
MHQQGGRVRWRRRVSLRCPPRASRGGSVGGASRPCARSDQTNQLRSPTSRHDRSQNLSDSMTFGPDAKAVRSKGAPPVLSSNGLRNQRRSRRRGDKSCCTIPSERHSCRPSGRSDARPQLGRPSAARPRFSWVSWPRGSIFSAPWPWLYPIMFRNTENDITDLGGVADNFTLGRNEPPTAGRAAAERGRAAFISSPDPNLRRFRLRSSWSGQFYSRPCDVIVMHPPMLKGMIRASARSSILPQWKERPAKIPVWVCAVKRRRLPGGERPTRRSAPAGSKNARFRRPSAVTSFGNR